ncbi:hypothetical protein SCT_0740 [Sulfuricella sp. T08]|nr:hypothetical protein SCT_0740 [Sulfuricella sp. T08]
MITALSVMLLIVMSSLPALAQEDDQKAAASPLRLSYVEGDVSFSRLGAEDWVEAQMNTPLAAGDALYVGSDGNLELQMGGRGFVRADDDTQLTLVNQTADFIQFRITSGRVSFDLRTLPTGFSVEVDTPNAVFTIDRTGYYRVDVNGDVHFITRRGGRAMMVPAGGQAMSILPSEEIVVQGGTVAQAKTYVAPELDQWDRWNYERTESLVDAVSERYLPAGIAGASDLDHYGRWRVVPDYGQVWVPDAVSPGWAPYSTGRWVWDPYYQWTWIDDAPWGWAPFHYGRWVHLGIYWAWAPGPVARQVVYAPALVAFFGVSSRVSVGIGIGGSGVGWVALSWGEPLTPWWGRPGFIGRPWWGGWHGPRVVNNVVIKQTTIVNVSNITYQNTRVSNAVVATTRERFGRGHVHDAPVRVTQIRELEHVRGALPIQPDPASLVAGAHRGVRPAESVLSRPVVSTRPPSESRLPWRTEAPKSEKKTAPEQRYVEMPKHPSNDLPRPEFGAQTGAERATPPFQPRFKERRRDAEPTSSGNVIRERAQTDRAEPRAPRTSVPEATTPPHAVREIAPPRAVQEQERVRATPEPRRGEATPGWTRSVPEATPQRERAERERADLPGKPANRVYRGQDSNKENSDRRRSWQKPDN